MGVLFSFKKEISLEGCIAKGSTLSIYLKQSREMDRMGSKVFFPLYNVAKRQKTSVFILLKKNSGIKLCERNSLWL